jgi:hypothetical protein
MDLSIAVMMHPTRQEYLPYLTERLGAVPVAMDRGLGVWDTCRRAWEAATGDFHLVVQDDALIARDFRARALALLTERCAYSFYFGWRQRFEAVAPSYLAAGGVVLPRLHWGLAVCLPREHIEPMLAFGEASALDPKLDDTRISRYLGSVGVPVRYPLPSLVDHRLTTSLVTGSTEACRRAIYFAGE